MKIEEMNLSEEVSIKLFEKLEKYNAANPEATLTAQEFSIKLLNYIILYIDTENISLD